ncbi:MAG: 4-hydroxythreonine-4-phosphate dehydrogenase PdxA [Marinilabiliaceae bacterium]|nr:4-hydroxythreonine-4-phosphate dehydrogenase PdxA [Marinilabiliaceae bacterium]
MSNEKILVGISHGDINGIGYEVIMKALEDARIFELCTPIIYGSAKVAAYHRKALDLPNMPINNIKKAEDAHSKRINIINCIDDEVRVELGKGTQMSGKAAFDALEKATKDLINKEIDVLVTAPIQKKMIQSDQFNFPGHTEYLEKAANNGKSLMLMVSDNLKVGVATGHIPVKDISHKLTTEIIVEKLTILNKTLLQDFSIRRPRIAVLGLNPHAGDDGLLGNEEKDIIIPAIEKAKQAGIVAMGPYPADGLFGSENLKKFDAVLAMYHDQGLTPFKAIAFSNGVNYTAGLPIIRTSPDHGTAYELAGTNVADHTSMLNAIYLAIDVYRNRNIYAEISKNPLKSVGKEFFEGKDVSVLDIEENESEI